MLPPHELHCLSKEFLTFFTRLSAAVVLAPDRNSFVNPMQLSPHIKTLKQNHVTCWQVSVEAVGLETVEAGEMELQAAAQAYVLVSCKSGCALCSLSLLYCGQRWDPKGAIQGTHFLDRTLTVKPQFSVRGVLVFHIPLCNGNG